VRAEADSYAAELRRTAASEATETTRDAREAAREVLVRGDELSANLSELGTSLRLNAERLLRAVRDAHHHLSAEVNEFSEGDEEPPPSRVTDLPSAGGLDVPEFVPRAGRRR
jgi:hypothetical protein